MQNKRCKIYKKNTSINANVIKELMGKMEKDYKIYDLKFQYIYFEDILVIQFLELIIYLLLKKNSKVSLEITLSNDDNYNLNNIFYISSFLNKIHKQYHTKRPYYKKNTKSRINKSEYINNFKKNHNLPISYRMYIESQQLVARNDMNKIITDLLEGINSLQSVKELKKDYILDIRELLLELITNVKNHTVDSDLVLQVNVSDVIKSDTKKEHKYFAISFYSLSNTLLYETTKKFYDSLKKNLVISEDRKMLYKNYEEIYNKQINYFDDEYSIEHFFMLQSFQNGITSRTSSFGKSSGTGLANAIQVIMNKIDDKEGFSYVYSGEKICYFKAKSLNFKDSICSFNEEEDYLQRPSSNICTESPVFFPGTAYQLIFPIKKEDAYEKDLQNNPF